METKRHRRMLRECREAKEQPGGEGVKETERKRWVE